MSAEALIVTGGLITSQERSLWQVARKCWRQFAVSQHAWLDAKIKLAIAEPMVARGWELRRLGKQNDEAAQVVRDYFEQPTLAEIPDLTRVVLHNCLTRAGVACQAVELSDPL